MPQDVVDSAVSGGVAVIRDDTEWIRLQPGAQASRLPRSALPRLTWIS